jgi:hypothetical protein
MVAGIRRVSSLAFPAFLASAASTLSRQDRILVSVTCQPDVHFETVCTAGHPNTATPSLIRCHRNRLSGSTLVLADSNIVESSLADARPRACYLAARAPLMGSWLQAMPVSNCGLKLGNKAVRVAVGLRLGLNQCLPHSCP